MIEWPPKRETLRRWSRTRANVLYAIDVVQDRCRNAQDIAEVMAVCIEGAPAGYLERIAMLSGGIAALNHAPTGFPASWIWHQA